MKYKDKSKEKGEKQYANKRGVYYVADLFGGMLGKAIRAKRAHKKKVNPGKKPGK